MFSKHINHVIFSQLNIRCERIKFHVKYRNNRCTRNRCRACFWAEFCHLAASLFSFSLFSITSGKFVLLFVRTFNIVLFQGTSNILHVWISISDLHYINYYVQRSDDSALLFSSLLGGLFWMFFLTIDFESFSIVGLSLVVAFVFDIRIYVRLFVRLLRSLLYVEIDDCWRRIDYSLLQLYVDICLHVLPDDWYDIFFLFNTVSFNNLRF